MKLQRRIKSSFLEVQKEFPFGEEALNGTLKRYTAIILKIMNYYPIGSKILSIGAGACALEAILSKLGYLVTAVDDLNDHWHLIGKNRERIKDFAQKMNIRLIVKSGSKSDSEMNNSFDVVLLIDIIEHLHNSPRDLLNFSISCLTTEGILIIETPNTVKLINRFRVLLGKSNQINSEFIYWCIGEYRSHIREYSNSELFLILSNQNLKSINIKMIDVTRIKTKGFFVRRNLILNTEKMISMFYPNFRDTILISGMKPKDWHPTKPSIDNFDKYYNHINKHNLDNEPDESLIKKWNMT